LSSNFSVEKNFAAVKSYRKGGKIAIQFFEFKGCGWGRLGVISPLENKRQSRRNRTLTRAETQGRGENQFTGMNRGKDPGFSQKTFLFFILNILFFPVK
jgi:hypothetical protein